MADDGLQRGAPAEARADDGDGPDLAHEGVAKLAGRLRVVARTPRLLENSLQIVEAVGASSLSLSIISKTLLVTYSPL